MNIIAIAVIVWTCLALIVCVINHAIHSRRPKPIGTIRLHDTEMVAIRDGSRTSWIEVPRA